MLDVVNAENASVRSREVRAPPISAGAVSRWSMREFLTRTGDGAICRSADMFFLQGRVRRENLGSRSPDASSPATRVVRGSSNEALCRVPTLKRTIKALECFPPPARRNVRKQRRRHVFGCGTGAAERQQRKQTANRTTPDNLPVLIQQLVVCTRERAVVLRSLREFRVLRERSQASFPTFNLETTEAADDFFDNSAFTSAPDTRNWRGSAFSQDVGGL